GNGVHPEQQSIWNAMEVRVDHRPEPIRKCHESGNENVHLAGTSQQDSPPRIPRVRRIQRLTRTKRQKQDRNRGENDADGNERADKMGKVPEVGVQRPQNYCNAGHAQRREARAKADRETRKYRRGDFGPSVTTEQGDCFREHQGRYDRSYEGCKNAKYNRQAEAENPWVQQSDFTTK